MGWASAHIERLLRGETVTFRPRGGSASTGGVRVPGVDARLVVLPQGAR